MGCGISTLDAEEKSLSLHSSRHGRHHAIVPPVPDKKDDDGVGLLKPLDGDDNEEAKKESEVGPNEEKLKEKCVMDKKKEEEEEERVFDHGGDDKLAKINVKNEEEHEENNDGDDSFSFIGPGSPSFRDYCIDYDSADRSSIGDSNDCDSVDSTKNGSGNDSINRNNKPENERSVNSNKEPERKERRGRGFRNVMNRGRAKGGRRNLLNFACYNASSESYSEGSLNKIAGKTT